MKTLETTTVLLATALRYAELGWQVFPIAPGKKQPPSIARWEQRATADPDRIRACWGEGTPWNIGIACGPSGLVVVDLDMPKPAKDELFVPEGTPTGIDQFTLLCQQHHDRGVAPARLVTSPRGGMHLYYTHPVDGPRFHCTTGKLAPLIDTRTHGGYIVAPPSTISGAGAYKLMRDVEPPQLPTWLQTLLTPEPPRVPTPVPVRSPMASGRRAAYLDSAIQRQVAHLRAAGAEGERRRNTTLWASATALGQLVAGGELTEDDVYTALEPVAHDIGLFVIETKKTIASGLRNGARNPRTVPGHG